VSEEGSPLRALDWVVIADTPEMSSIGEARRRGVVTEVRRYPDGSYRYGVGFFEDGEMGGLYASEHLQPLKEAMTPVEAIVDSTPKSFVSTKVSEDGSVTGREGYMVLERVVDE